MATAARGAGLGRMGAPRGTYAFTACIKEFGAVVATGMGIGRKFLSVVASYWLFPKLVFVQHWVRRGS